MLQYNFTDDLKKHIQECSRNAVLFLNHYPSETEKSDGYFNRVLFIDNIFSDYIRCYVNQSNLIESVSLNIISTTSFQINIPEYFTNDHDLVEELILLFPNVYAHSIFALLTEFKQAIFSKANCAIWDVHGVVPEEHVLAGNHSDDVIKFVESVEELAFKRAKHVLTVTNCMVNHLKAKYKKLQLDKNYILLPIISLSVANNFTKKTYNSERPVVIYSGGNQVWQQVDKMLSFVHQNKHKFNFIFLIANSSEVKLRYEELFIGELFPGIIKTVSSSEVGDYYNKADYGLMLRDAIIVNHVSCPTKLLDYMSFGIIPIINCAEIGDFNNLGYKYVHYHDENILNSKDYEQYASTNMQVLKLLQNYNSEGRMMLRKALQHKQDTNIYGLEFYVILISHALKLFEAENLFKNTKLQLESELSQSRSEALQLERELSKSRSDNSELNIDLFDLRNEIDIIRNSTSWVITEPLRKMGDFIRKKKN